MTTQFLISFLLIIVFSDSNLLLHQLKMGLCVKIPNEDGCPYTFDLGNKGFEYLKPSTCLTLLPKNYTIPPQKGLGSDAPYKIRLMYTAEEATYLVRIESTEIKSPIHQLLIEVRKISKKGKIGDRVGFFEPNQDFLGYCCENNKLQNLFHRPTVTGISIYKLDIKWTPLTFVGKVYFRANIFSSRTTWYSNVTSKQYTIPPPDRPLVKRRLKKIQYKIIPNDALWDKFTKTN